MVDYDYLLFIVFGNLLLCFVCYFDIFWVFIYFVYQYDNFNKRIRFDLYISKLEICVYKVYNFLIVLIFNLLLVFSNV